MWFNTLAYSFNCTDTRYRSVLDTHNLTQAYDADRAIFPWQQCYSSFPLRNYFLLVVFSFHVFPFIQLDTGRPIGYSYCTRHEICKTVTYTRLRVGLSLKKINIKLTKEKKIKLTAPTVCTFK